MKRSGVLLSRKTYHLQKNSTINSINPVNFQTWPAGFPWQGSQFVFIDFSAAHCSCPFSDPHFRTAGGSAMSAERLSPVPWNAERWSKFSLGCLLCWREDGWGPLAKCCACLLNHRSPLHANISSGFCNSISESACTAELDVAAVATELCLATLGQFLCDTNF